MNKQNTPVLPHEFSIQMFAYLYLFQGVNSLISTVFTLIRGEVNFDLGFLFLFLGVGLLRRQDPARRVTLFLAFLGTLFVIFQVYDAGQSGAQATFDFFYLNLVIPFPSLAFYIANGVIVALLIWQILVLTNKEVRETFDSEAREPTFCWKPFVVFSAGLLIVAYSAVYFLNASLKDLNVRKTRIVVEDADTGQLLDPSINTASFLRSSSLPRGNITFKPSEVDGVMIVELTWLALSPVGVGVSHEGYESQLVLLDPKDEEALIRVKLVKRDDAEEKTEAGGGKL